MCERFGAEVRGWEARRFVGEKLDKRAEGSSYLDRGENGRSLARATATAEAEAEAEATAKAKATLKAEATATAGRVEAQGVTEAG